MTAEPLRVLSLGAGVQSTTLLLLALEGELPRPDLVVFADTQYEPQAVYGHLVYLEGLMTAAGVPFRRVTAGDIREDTLARTPTRRASMPFFVRGEDGQPGMLLRQCTVEYKVKPIRRAIRAFLKDRGEVSADLLMGISLDEAQRMRMSEVKYLTNRYPLVDRRWTRADCLNWLQARGYPKPPRSACIACPYRSNAEWRALPPAEWADAVAFDAGSRRLPRIEGTVYLHRSRVPLPMVDLSTEQERGQMEMWGDECAGVCGV
jgi:hypothetical protein